MLTWIPLEYYIVTALVNFATCAVVSVTVFLAKFESATVRRFGLFTVFLSCWFLFYFLWLSEENLIVADFYVRTVMLFICLMPISHVPFIYMFTRTPRRRRFEYANFLICTVFASLVFTDYYSPYQPDLGFLVFPHWPKAGPLFTLQVIYFVGLYIRCVWLLCRAYRNTSGNEQKRIGLFLLGFSLLATEFINYLPWYRVPFPPVLNATATIFVLICTYAILRYQFLDIRLVIRRGLVYSALIAFVTAAYFSTIIIFERWFQGLVGYQSVFATMLAGFVLAISFNPLRDWLHRLVDRALFNASPAEMADQRDQLLEEVRKSEQMKAVGTLAAGLAHEIKNPLASIKTFTEYLPQKADDPQFLNKFQRIVGGEVERIQHSVQELLAFAKPTPPRLEIVNLAQLLRDTAELLSRDLMQKHIDVLDETDPRVMLSADPQQMKQVFLNLLLNALQAMEEGGRLTLRASTGGAHAVIEVADTGPGMSAQQVRKIFDPFYSTKTQGTGLGLTVVKRILDEHRAKIDIQSHPGKGTQITIRLPLA